MALRFNTDRSLFETFPTAAKDVGVEPRDIEPTVLARTLASEGKMSEAVSVCAYMLSRRESVAWGCQSLRSMERGERTFSSSPLQAAELWVEQATDLRRAAAQQVGAESDDNEPATWLARAAGWSSGHFAPNVPVPVPPHLAAASVRVAVILALHRLKPGEKLERSRTCVEAAIRMAEADRQP